MHLTEKMKVWIGAVIIVGVVLLVSYTWYTGHQAGGTESQGGRSRGDVFSFVDKEIDFGNEVKDWGADRGIYEIQLVNPNLQFPEKTDGLSEKPCKFYETGYSVCETKDGHKVIFAKSGGWVGIVAKEGTHFTKEVNRESAEKGYLAQKWKGQEVWTKGVLAKKSDKAVNDNIDVIPEAYKTFLALGGTDYKTTLGGIEGTNGVYEILFDGQREVYYNQAGVVLVRTKSPVNIGGWVFSKKVAGGWYEYTKQP